VLSESIGSGEGVQIDQLVDRAAGIVGQAGRNRLRGVPFNGRSLVWSVLFSPQELRLSNIIELSRSSATM